MFSKVVIILGGNKGDRIKLLNQAVQSLSEVGEITRKSAIYETAAWGGVAKGAFLNQAIILETQLSPDELLAYIQNVEKQLGRKRDDHWGDRTMDLDILYFGEHVISTDSLQIPHPYIAQRRFVLVPLVEILPEFIHPVLEKNQLELLEECEDKSAVMIFNPS